MPPGLSYSPQSLRRNPIQDPDFFFSLTNQTQESFRFNSDRNQEIA